MDGLTLRTIARLTDRRYSGLQITDVRWVSPGGLWIGFSRGLPGLVLSVHPSVYGLFSATKENSFRSAAPEPVRVMKKHLKGARIQGVNILNMERVVKFSTERVSPTGKKRGLILIFEAISRWSNLILIEEPGDVVVTALKVFTGTGGLRTVMPGRPYSPPPVQKRTDPAKLSGEDLILFLEKESSGIQNAEVLSSLLAGLSADTAEDIIEVSKVRGGAGPGTLAATVTAMIQEPVREGFITGGRRGHRRLALAFPGVDESGAGEKKDLMEAAGDYYLEVSRAIDIKKRAFPVARDLRRHLRQMEKLVLRLKADLAEADLSEEYRQRGSVIMAHLKEIKRGMLAFETVEPFGQAGMRISVPLESRLSPVANAEKYFRKARKLESGAGYVKDKLEKLEDRLEKLRMIRMEIEETDDPGRIESLDVAAKKFLEIGDKPAERKVCPRRIRPAKRYLEYTATGGFRIIVGKNAPSNDYIMNRVASPEDLWCHAEGYSGAHVILKRIKTPDAALNRALEEACMLAAYYSKGREQLKVTVSYTRRKYVHKPRGASPGLVILRQRKTMVVQPLIPESAQLKTGK